MPRCRKIAILLFDDVEPLDFCGPFEVFAVAARLTDPAAFEVVTVAERSGPVTARYGLSVNPTMTLGQCVDPEILLVPGGLGTRREIDNADLLSWIEDCAASAELVLSVCTGALLLAKIGLLDGLSATTHHDSFDRLESLAPNTKVERERRVVDNGKIVLSAGIASGIEMSLHVVARLLGPDQAVRTAHQMEYPWECL